METHQDVANRVRVLIDAPSVKVIFFSCAMVDWWDPESGGKYEPRPTSAAPLNLRLMPTEKIIRKIREKRKDIFLVGFKSVSGLTAQEAYLAGLKLCKEASCNLVLVNDTSSRRNMIVTPEEAAYHDGFDRDATLKGLVEMARLRSHLTFTRSTVVKGDPISWNSPLVPDSLRTVVDHCRSQNAYKAFKGSTVGHFAARLSDTVFLTSIRRSNFNELEKVGLVRIETDGPDTVLAYGSKPSVGGQSQRMIFRDHPGFDCVVHFHCPMRPDAPAVIPIRSQRDVECGSHECGAQTSGGLAKFGNLKAVMLDQHGPNIIFPKWIDPREVIEFIERNFDLSKKTGGYQLEDGIQGIFTGQAKTIFATLSMGIPIETRPDNEQTRREDAESDLELARELAEEYPPVVTCPHCDGAGEDCQECCNGSIPIAT